MPADRERARGDKAKKRFRERWLQCSEPAKEGREMKRDIIIDDGRPRILVIIIQLFAAIIDFILGLFDPGA